MKITIELPATIEANVRGLPVVIDLASAVNPEEFVRRLALYGVRKFNDASPMGETAPTDETGKTAFKRRCADNAEAMVKAWLAGDFETERGGRVSDPLTQKAREIARALVTAKYGKLGKDATDVQKTDFAERVRKAAMLDQVLKLAQSELDKAAKLADLI
jgi:hypothetical protein